MLSQHDWLEQVDNSKTLLTLSPFPVKPVTVNSHETVIANQVVVLFRTLDRGMLPDSAASCEEPPQTVPKLPGSSVAGPLRPELTQGR